LKNICTFAKKIIVNLEKFSDWVWDIAKYVLSAVIISSFLGRFTDNAFWLYTAGFTIVIVLFAIGAYIQKYLKNKNNKLQKYGSNLK